MAMARMWQAHCTMRQTSGMVFNSCVISTHFHIFHDHHYQLFVLGLYPTGVSSESTHTAEAMIKQKRTKRARPLRQFQNLESLTCRI
jgi:hypothetical protein